MKGIEYSRGGRCPVNHLIKVPKGAPKCPDHPIWLGVLEGSWYDIGKQFGESVEVRSYIPPLLDHLFRLAMEKFSIDELLECLRSMEKQLSLYEPGFVEALQGEADGAAEALSESKYAGALSDYDKILLINFNSYPLLYSSLPRHDCSSIVLLPQATMDGKLITGRNTQLGRAIGNYGVAYAAIPPSPGHRYMTNTYAGMLFGLGIVADTPMYVCTTAGVGQACLGIEETFLLAKAAIFGENIDEVCDIILHGSESYRRTNGRASTLRAYPTNYTIADERDALILETLIDRWAVRRPGDFGEMDFIIATNHQLCEYSYDENDVRTNVPMYHDSICNRFGGCRNEMDPKLKDKIFAGYDTRDLTIPSPNDGLIGSWTRYWTLYWSAMYNHGKIDMKMLQGPQFLGSRFWYDLNGKKIEYQMDPATGTWTLVYYLYPHSTVEGNTGGYPEQYNNEIPGSLAYVPMDRTAYWQLYKPSMWEGEWEKVTFR
ncbi:hypothetical protein ACFLWZ_04610 [Chloroflexota bacterium]